MLNVVNKQQLHFIHINIMCNITEIGVTFACVQNPRTPHEDNDELRARI